MIIGLAADTHITQGPVAGESKAPPPPAQTSQSFARVLAGQMAALVDRAQPVAPSPPDPETSTTMDMSDVDEDNAVLAPLLYPAETEGQPTSDLSSVPDLPETAAQAALPEHSSAEMDGLPVAERAAQLPQRGENAPPAMQDGPREKPSPSDSAAGRSAPPPDVPRKRPVSALEFHIAPPPPRVIDAPATDTTDGTQPAMASVTGAQVADAQDIDATTQVTLLQASPASVALQVTSASAAWQAAPASAELQGTSAGAAADMPVIQVARVLAAGTRAAGTFVIGQDPIFDGGQVAPVVRAKYSPAEVFHTAFTSVETTPGPDRQPPPLPNAAAPQVDTLFQANAAVVEQLLTQPAPESQVQTAEAQAFGAGDSAASQTQRATAALIRPEAALSSSMAQALQTVSDSGQGVFELDIWDGLGGKLRISVSAIDGAVQISMLSGRVDMLDLLKRSLNLLRDDLTALGFKSIDLKLVNASAAAPLHQLQILHPAARTRADMVFDTPSAPPRPAGIDMRL
ncbi:hypothetical protein [Roseinatronobacter sp. NSM]|uniref:hypothetical protein n=1 Tax=Roseinatronobacter sp. NSM TaxID=3457785 RepID=UPI0040367E4F